MASTASSSQPPMRAVDPQPMPSPSNVPYVPPTNAPQDDYQAGSNQGFPPQLGPESHLPNQPDGTVSIPTVPGHTLTPLAPSATVDVGNLRANVQFHLREYLRVRNKMMQGWDGSITVYELETRLRTQAGMALSDLSILQAEVRALSKSAQGSRWSRLFVAGAIGAFIPAIRRIFRRGSDQESQVSSNDTEYAFRRSKRLLSGMKNAILGGGAFAKIAFFVFAVLYVFQNEVTIRVARTLNKRLKRLTERLERGDGDLNETDLRILDGWRWRVILW